MAFRKFHRHRILNFAIRENAMEEPISESLHGMLNARAFDHIHANADDAHESSGSAPDDSHVQKRCAYASHSKALRAKPEADSFLFAKLWECGASSRRFSFNAFIHRNSPLRPTFPSRHFRAQPTSRAIRLRDRY